MAAKKSKFSDRKLLESFEAGEARALARAISWVENGRPGFEDLLSALHGKLGRAQRIGITGPPGAGKSTLIHGLAALVRKRDERVGVVAVDPTSPFTGGALLGDRIRMTSAIGDEGIFIRSMASRGSLGGLATTTREVADLMDAFGFERVVVETVGVGQSELEIAEATDTTVVVLTPESGDSVQAMKAGLMEIADIFVVNKADRPEAKRAAGELRTVLRIRQGQTFDRIPAHHGVDLTRMAERRARAGGDDGGEAAADAGTKRWEIPVLMTAATGGEGVPELLETLDAHLGHLEETGELTIRRNRRTLERVRAVVNRGLRTRVWRGGPGTEMLEAARPDLESGRRSPYEVADEILRSVMPDG
ncbi:MAG: methylmalonyl Co-A mutase-associated GTPase MeaB [Gemmatimonadetes bacterium]|uniref:Methylmalonyl Co-A mutase-associated GTPase MeaB n=1 Tax=Candidatus Kutchimonas denitrificans TaxID=3056748 RepID=A0AAE5CCT3_9BACT|nr:methylmalonyl Co-A mutase-associated GTPase MeaB [Gemmatimonadota bacterium]NIR74624.1 methylmalonyl Co-A mutase-associated GTPase MeaB [Candidatus Kutchimonas denitrificans]NIS02814.1 methylmalonyl Co-A mutase-associated GTPase MeaB [Gemmatimonadota bacterium]NIT68975.1 methylmalonyl Co-A mutase-associated GTPase MeaB [Gemmatimonadota bacterium]NIU52280.1 methylmalonyl Co-A mutase-associated GTPase MeaB [Gemmatimonadota bacterium]